MTDDMTTHYPIIVQKLEGKSLVRKDTHTDVICHIRTKEIMPGVVIKYALDITKGILYIHKKAELTW